MLLLSLLALVGIAPAVAQMMKVSQITEFGPLTGALLNTIIKGPDGALWFTQQGDGQPGTSKIGRITITGQISEFPDPVSLGFMVNLTAGPDGNVWLTEFSGSFFARACEAVRESKLVNDVKTEPLLRLQGEHVTPNMSDFQEDVWANRSPSSARTIDTLEMSIPLEERHQRAFLHITT